MTLSTSKHAYNQRISFRLLEASKPLALACQQVCIRPNAVLFNLIGSTEPTVFGFVFVELPNALHIFDMKFTGQYLAHHLFHHLWDHFGAFPD